MVTPEFQMVQEPKGRTLPSPVEKLLHSVASNDAGRSFPPIAKIRTLDGGTRVAMATRDLGAEDIDTLRATLETDLFAPFRWFVDSLDNRCGQWRVHYGPYIMPSLLDITQSNIFGPVLCLAFTQCTFGASRKTIQRLFDNFCRAFELLLMRVETDSREGIFAKADIKLPIVHMVACSHETHNGQQSVFRVDFTAGGRWAYKPRPATGESLFLKACAGQIDSLFALLNALPQATPLPIKLPTLRIIEGKGPDADTYGWHEWIERLEDDREKKCYRQAPSRAKTTIISSKAAARFWRNAGSLTAVCYTFGITDLFSENILFGRSARDSELMPYPIDLEMFFLPVEDLAATGLIGGDESSEEDCPAAFESKPRKTSIDGPLACFYQDQSRGLVLRPRSLPWGNVTHSNLLADDSGRVGYGAYALDFIRGLFDAWVLMRENKARIMQFITSQPARVRLALKPSSTYAKYLAASWLGQPQLAPEDVYLSPEEKEQIDRGDIPYFFRSVTDGRIQWLTGAGLEAAPAGHQAVESGCFDE